MVDELTPVVAPGRTAISGANWITDMSSVGFASGTASGTVTSASEDWARTTQTLRFDYVRVPGYVIPAALDVFGLNQFSAVDNVSRTELYVVATLYNRQEKVHLPIGTSGFTQLQKLTINPQSTDQYGVSYGTVSGFIMGPQGSVVTTMPYIKQEKWDDLIHTTHEFNQIGTTHGRLNTSALTWGVGTNLGDPLMWYPSYRQVWWNFVSIGGQPQHKQIANYWMDRYSINGGYNTSAEDAWDDEGAGRNRLISIIESLCDSFTGSNTNQRMAVEQPTNSNGYWWIQDGDRVAQNVYYDTFRHDYT
jgi:hypothetical protein